MSQPARPTRVKRNAVFASGVPRRRSAKSAIIAPAPTQTPSTAAMTGCGQARMALTRSPVMRVKASRPFMSRVQQRADDVVHVSAGGEVAAVRGDDDGLDVVVCGERTERVAKLGIGVERQRVLPLGPGERDDGDAPSTRQLKCVWLETVSGRSHSRALLPKSRAYRASRSVPGSARGEACEDLVHPASWASAMRRSGAGPWVSSRTKVARRSLALAMRTTRPLGHQPVDDACHIAVGHHEVARHVASWSCRSSAAPTRP